MRPAANGVQRAGAATRWPDGWPVHPLLLPPGILSDGRVTCRARKCNGGTENGTRRDGDRIPSATGATLCPPPEGVWWLRTSAARRSLREHEPWHDAS